MAITIPPAALEAGVKAFAEAEENAYTTHEEDLRAACLAMLEGWPGMHFIGNIGVYLPLPQEASDDQ